MEFEQVMRENGPLIYTLAVRLTGNSADGQDLAQETFVKAYENFSQFRGESEAGTWLYRICVNLWKNRVRYEKRRFFWRHFSLGSRDGDSPPAPAHVAQFALAPMGPLTYIDTKLVAAQVATAAVRLQGGKLRLCIWNISRNGRLSRAYDSDFDVVKEVAMDFWKIGTASYGGPPTPESIVVAAAAMADSSLGLFQFGASVNTVIVG